MMKTEYKKTKLGLIPEDWEYCLLDKVTERGSGHTPSKKKYDEYYNGGIKWVSLADSSKLDNGWIAETAVEISEEGLNNSSAVLHPKGTVLLSRDAGVGKSAVMQTEMAVSQHFIVWKVLDEQLNNWFLYYWLQFDKKEFERIAIGSTIKTIGLPFFKKYKIPLPPLPEQVRIADCLSQWDRGIALLERLIAQKEEQKKGLMQQLLTGRQRLPGFAGEKGYKKTKLGLIPEDWEVVVLEDTINVFRGGSPRPIKNYITKSAEGINWIKIGDTKADDKYITSSVEKIIEEGAERSRRVYVGDFLLSNSMSFGRPYILQIDGCIHDGWLVLQNYKASFDKDFLYYSLTAAYIYKQYIQRAAGSSVLNLNKDLVKSIKLLKPSLPEQKAIAAVLNTADRELSLLGAKLGQYRLQKRGLMQQLLMGRKRLV